MNEITEGNFPEVRSRQEMYLQDIIKSLSNESISDNNYPDPLSRQEAYLQIIISKLRANDPNIEINTEDIEKAVNKYLEQNPIQPGATENQAQQIEKNKKDVASLKAETGSLKEDKITKPAEVPTVGKILRVKSVNEDGTFVCEWADGGSNLDVRINGESIVQDGVAEIPILNTDNGQFGVVKTRKLIYGIGANVNGELFVHEANNVSIDYRQQYRAITPYAMDYAVKAAMCDGKGAAWTADEQAAARERMGTWTTIADFTLDEDVNSINKVSVQGYRKYSVVVLLSQIITTDCYIRPNLICANSEATIAYESAKNMTFLLFNIEEFGYIGDENSSSLFGCESYKNETGAISPNTFKYSTGKVNYNGAGKFPFLTGIGVIANGASIPSGSRIIIRGHN